MSNTMLFIDLGWPIGKLDLHRHTLRIVSPSDDTDTGHSPSQSVVLYGQDNLVTLRDALLAAFPLTPEEDES